MKLTKFTTVDRKSRMFTIFYENAHYTAALVKYETTLYAKYGKIVELKIV